jgi:hypothetical protein
VHELRAHIGAMRQPTRMAQATDTKAVAS